MKKTRSGIEKGRQEGGVRRLELEEATVSSHGPRYRWLRFDGWLIFDFEFPDGGGFQAPILAPAEPMCCYSLFLSLLFFSLLFSQPL